MNHIFKGIILQLKTSRLYIYNLFNSVICTLSTASMFRGRTNKNPWNVHQCKWGLFNFYPSGIQNPEWSKWNSLNWNHGENNKLPLGLWLCFRIVRGYMEIYVFLFKRECCDLIRGFIFHLANVPRHTIPLINLKFYQLNQFSNISYV